MSPELQRYYEDRFEMCVSQGWKDLIQDVKEMLEATNTLDGVETLEKLHFRKGEISIMNWLLEIEHISKETYQELLDEESA